MITNRLVLIIGFVTLSFFQVFGQDKVEKTHTDFRKKHGYEAGSEYKGPSRELWVSPQSMQEENYSYSSSGSSYQGIPVSRKALKSGRPSAGSSSSTGNGGSGNTKEDPTIDESDDIDFDPDIDIDPNVNLKPSISSTFWYILLILLALVLLAIIVYFVLKNKAPMADKSISFEPIEENLNPATISKTELELRLEAAIEEENYKECVRIFFLFAMKHLIEKRLVFWKKEKTNVHYSMEMMGKEGSFAFNEIIKWYDLVWYGDYTLNREGYERISPLLENAYKQIVRAHE